MSNGTASFSSYDYGNDNTPVFTYRDQNMCGKWKSTDYDLANCGANVTQSPNGIFIVTGTVPTPLASFVKYWAAAPPTYNQSFTGSGMPFPNPAVAFENTPNKGVVKISGGKYRLTLKYPNSYYKDMCNTYVPPQVSVVFCDASGKKMSKIYKIKLGNGVPYRSLVWNQQGYRKNVMGYCNNNLPVRTQEQILRDSAYPKTNEQAPNFWGKRPPC